MARHTESVCRLCRREGAKLFLKGTRCYTKKCSFERRPTPPGQHGVRRRKVGDFGLQLREKQKIRRVYGVLERQFRNYFIDAENRPGVTGESLLRHLELRLDNVVYRMGFATSRAQARQLVNHGHVTVNGRKVDIPSYQVKPADVLAIKDATRKNTHVEGAWQTAAGRGRPAWISAAAAEMSATITGLPTREDVDRSINEQLIVELYSK